ncbi:tautomerase family protein [Caballeronia sp. LZ065]|uniref:tautomerase family protein n=1 Tax=Caballeronia sp. LZ065 TaxID=3038571 RepID=UPI00285505A6|nr:tautomerase family protein [Caballeronia sp. LZ065]MDR5781249.1 tautomerase family protein [Caballeronia sp. LZ065]
MPIIEVNLIEGRSLEVKRRIITALTDATIEAAGVRREDVRIIIRDIPPENFAVGGAQKYPAAQGREST